MSCLCEGRSGPQLAQREETHDDTREQRRVIRFPVAYKIGVIVILSRKKMHFHFHFLLYLSMSVPAMDWIFGSCRYKKITQKSETPADQLFSLWQRRKNDDWVYIWHIESCSSSPSKLNRKWPFTGSSTLECEKWFPTPSLGGFPQLHRSHFEKVSLLRFPDV